MGEFGFHNISDAPEHVAPFSHAFEVDGWEIVTVQMPPVAVQPDASLASGMAAQTRQVMENLKTVLAGVGLDSTDVAQCCCFLTDFWQGLCRV